MIIFENVSKKFGTGAALSDISFLVDKGEFVFLVGPTGSGKTTVLRLITRELFPTHGKVIVNNWDVIKLPHSKIPELRKKIGVIFQDLKLLADRTIFENTALPLDVAGLEPEQIEKRVEEVLKQVGIDEHRNKFPSQLSGGELQRVAIARALALSPEIILADEPTGNLDPATSWEIVKVLSDINEQGTTIVMATHNADIVKSLSKRVLELSQSNLVKDSKTKHKAKDKEEGKEEKEDASTEQQDEPKEDEKQ